MNEYIKYIIGLVLYIVSDYAADWGTCGRYTRVCTWENIYDVEKPIMHWCVSVRESVNKSLHYTHPPLPHTIETINGRVSIVYHRYYTNNRHSSIAKSPILNQIPNTTFKTYANTVRKSSIYDLSSPNYRRQILAHTLQSISQPLI